MRKSEKAAKIRGILSELFPQPPIPLSHQSPFQLLVAVVLSAQTTDKKVNEVTPELFRRAPTPQAMRELGEAAILEIIRTVGLAPQKAKALAGLGTRIVDDFAGQVPRTFEELESLPGVGHKTASVVMTQAFGLPAFPVDTHIQRLAERWGLSDGSSVTKTERDLKALWPPEQWHDLHLQIIYFGRTYCPALRHDTKGCPICAWAAPRRPRKAQATRPRAVTKGARGGMMKKGAARRTRPAAKTR